MKVTLLSALASSALLASVSPGLAQFPPNTAEQGAALTNAAPRAVAVPPAFVTTTVPALVTAPAVAGGGRPYDSLIATHAASNGIPVELVHRVVVRESRY